MDNIFRIPSRLYFELYQKGGDRLISVYAILKKAKKNDVKYYAFTSKNGKNVSGYSLLRYQTNITLHSLKKHVPSLIELGLCHFDNNGDFVMLGNEKTKELYSSFKMIPIIIGKNLIHTAYNVMQVRFNSLERRQLYQIERKHNQRVLLKRKDNPRNSKELKAIQRIEKNKKRDSFFIDKCVLSVQSYAYIKDYSESKSKGAYWKKVLSNKKIVETKRRFKIIKKMTLSEFITVQSIAKLSKVIKYVNGYMVQEVVSEFKTFTIQKQCKLLTPTIANTLTV